MRNILLSIGVLITAYSSAQVNVYECGVVNPSVAPSEVLNGAFGFYRPCIEFGANHNFQFSGDVHKDIKASEYIHIKEGFHAGLFNENKGVHLRTTPKALFDVAVLNYPDLNHIEKLKKVEFGVDLEGEIENRIKAFLALGSGVQPTLYELNPFIADDMNSNTSEISMHATFIHPSTWTVKERDFFYYHEYEQIGSGYGVDVPNINTGEYGWSDALNDNNDYLMRVRFAPPRAGEWEAHFSITYDGNTVQLPVFTFLVDDNNHPGFVKVHHNQRNLRRDDGIVFPLGHVFPGPYNRANGEQVAWGEPAENKTEYNTTVADWNQYLGDVESYINQGGKSFKIAQTSYGNLIEFEELGNYRKRLQYAWEQDKILDMCEENDVLLNFNFLFQDVIMGYGQNADGTVGDPWDYGTYGPDRQPGFLSWYPNYCYFVPNTLPSNQFLDPKMMNYHKQRTRYYVARYGYSPQIYTWELMSESFHMDAFHLGEILVNGTLMSDEPATQTEHPGHKVAIEAINVYHNELSEYIKNDLKDKDHLITFSQTILDDNPDIYPYDCALNENIDVIGYHYYSEKPYKLVETKEDKNGKENLGFSVGERSMYQTISNKFVQVGFKPIILSEAGHVNPYLGLDCHKTVANDIDVMTNGFIGVAGMHPWEGYRYGHTPPSGELQFDERLLWPATIAAEKHMNSDNVLPTLDHWDGLWKQGRQIAFVKKNPAVGPDEDREVKELQYYLSQSNELATGYVRNRSYNIFTASASTDPTNCPISVSLQYPFNTFYVYQFNDGPDKNHLYVKGLQKDAYYQTTWFDYLTGQQLPVSQFHQADNKNRIKLHYPTLTIFNPLRPILWFTTQKVNLRPEEEEQIVQESVAIRENLVFGAYPNPFNNELMITSEQNDQVTIYSVTGSLVRSLSLSEAETTISTAHLEKGIYFIHSSNSNQTIKLVKQ